MQAVGNLAGARPSGAVALGTATTLAMALAIGAGTRAASPGAATRVAAEAESPCSDPATRTQRTLCFPSLLIHDAGYVFRGPARWGRREWGLVAAGALGVAALTTVDDRLRTAVLRDPGGSRDAIARVFEPFGTWAAFATLGGFYFTGLAAHDVKARGVALDGLASSIIAAGVIVPVLKEIAGRSRPREGLGPHHFEPFHGGASFPSGHAANAFAVASVIATEYPSPWVKTACYLPASLVLYARMRHDAHWASDVTAGALIGYGVGRTVARHNLPLRIGDKDATIAPILAPGKSGVRLTATF